MRNQELAAAAAFPSLYQEIATDRLLSVFEAAPRRIGLALEGLDGAALSARPIPEKWSIQEIVCHVADSETVAALRFRLALAQPGSRLPGYDQDRFAAGIGYAKFDPPLVRDTFELFSRLRSISSRILRRLDPAEWDRSGIHPDWGELSVRQLLELYADHGERHLEQILERRAKLGRPLAMERLLPVRLY
ncbi:MAG TPA: DinB family protein [Thermoanaerobaculia bacterium]|nr:DinB family protein [Thermoanaerobaculia bacterium]